MYLDRSCRVTRTVGYPTPPRDPEDLAIAPDGTLWVADIGDNVGAQNRRQSIALWRVPSGGGAPVINRLTYPDGPHDAEALLFAADGSPIIVTKELGGTAYLYQPTGPLQPGTAAGVPMRRVGDFRPTATGAANSLGAIGETAVTGAATSPDRRRIALRTYTAAYEWDVPDGDIVKAITTSTPRLTPLPDEPQGEAIAYTMDGQEFLTLSDESGPTTLRRYRPSAELAPAAATSTSPTNRGATGSGIDKYADHVVRIRPRGGWRRTPDCGDRLLRTAPQPPHGRLTATILPRAELTPGTFSAGSVLEGLLARGGGRAVRARRCHWRR